MRIAFVCGELYPFPGGGLGQFVSAAARALSPVADVLVLTSSVHEPEYRRLRAAGDKRLPPAEVQVEFVPHPSAEEAEGFFCDPHCYSALAYERLRELYGARGPDVIEFADYLAEGFVTIQAAQTLDPFLAGTIVCVRLHTSKEVCDVLNGWLPDDLWSRATYAMEREGLAYADRIIWQGGDILGCYRRFYGAGALGGDVRIRYPFRGPSSAPGTDRERELADPLRLLYFGRLERRKGIYPLMCAATQLPGDDWSLTFIGDDTPTGPLGGWMGDLLELARADDPRIEVRGGMQREDLHGAIRSSGVVVLPSLWECWPYAALEALHSNRPLLATPTGGFTELVQPGRSGWLTDDTSVPALERGLQAVIDARLEVRRMIQSEQPREVGAALTSDADFRNSYSALADAVRPRAASGVRPASVAERTRKSNGEGPRGHGRRPLVSAVIPYYAAHRFLPSAIASLTRETYAQLEIIVINDGSFAARDIVLGQLAARYPICVLSEPNSGLGAARNFGVSQSRGRYVAFLDADNLLEPGFIARCVDVLETRAEVAYVTAWSRYIDEQGEPLEQAPFGYQPFGNHHAINDSINVAGDAAAVIRRRIFDLGLRYSEELASYEDWHFYRALRRAGHIGAVIPERLIRHRVRPNSMMREVGLNNLPRLEHEIAATLKGDSVRWTS